MGELMHETIQITLLPVSLQITLNMSTVKEGEVSDKMNMYQVHSTGRKLVFLYRTIMSSACLIWVLFR